MRYAAHIRQITDDPAPAKMDLEALEFELLIAAKAVAINPRVLPVFERADRDYRLAKAAREDPIAMARFMAEQARLEKEQL